METGTVFVLQDGLNAVALEPSEFPAGTIVSVCQESEASRSLITLINETPIYRDVIKERERQDQKWGGAEHDDCHTVADWAQLIQDFAAWARAMGGMDDYTQARERLMQVAALAVAACEALDRKIKDAEQFP